MSSESVVYEAADHATFDSKRKGNWATPGEIKTRMDKGINENFISVLNRLVHKKDVEKKKDARLYRTKKGGGGGLGLAGIDEGYKSPDGYDNGRTPYPDYPGKTPSDERGGTPGDNVRAGLTALLGGVAAGASGGTTGGGTTGGKGILSA